MLYGYLKCWHTHIQLLRGEIAYAVTHVCIQVLNASTAIINGPLLLQVFFRCSAFW
jgi:hypothetical protein